MMSPKSNNALSYKLKTEIRISGRLSSPCLFVSDGDTGGVQIIVLEASSRVVLTDCTSQSIHLIQTDRRRVVSLIIWPIDLLSIVIVSTTLSLTVTTI